MPFSNGQKHHLIEKKCRPFAIHSFLFLSLSFKIAMVLKLQFAQLQD